MIPIYQPYFTKSSLKYAHEALDSTWIASTGKYLSLVQEKLQELLNVKYVIPVNNGTSAMHLVAKCASQQNKNEIIIPNNSYVAAWNAFLFDGNWKLFTVDCDLKTWNYDLQLLDQAIKDHPDAAVLIVHNIGNIINVPALQRKYSNTLFVEDNCEGFLGLYEGMQSGTSSFASAISFYSNKNITSGEGGAFITNDENMYNLAKCIHGQGQSNKRFIHNQLGYNYRMTNIQAAILYGQIEILPEIMNKKTEVFNTYRNTLKDREDILMQEIEPNTIHSNWMFGVHIPQQKTYDDADIYFKKKGVEIRPMFYPITEHNHLINNKNIIIQECKNAKLLNNQSFILPSYPELSKDEQTFILTTLSEYVKELK